jgi:hypothetical protein
MEHAGVQLTLYHLSFSVLRGSSMQKNSGFNLLQAK